jgi:hypothetical protein
MNKEYANERLAERPRLGFKALLRLDVDALREAGFEVAREKSRQLGGKELARNDPPRRPRSPPRRALGF